MTLYNTFHPHRQQGRVFELIDRAPAVLTSGGKKLPSFDGRVEFDKVCFRYPSRPEVEVLTDVSLTLEPGKVRPRLV